MPKLSFSDNLAIAGIIATIILVALDKAGKLEGPLPVVLLTIAAAMTLPVVFGNSWVSEAATAMLRIARGLLLLFSVGVIYSALLVWISTDAAVPEAAARKGAISEGDRPTTVTQVQPQPSQTESQRRQLLLARLRNEYILSHDGLSAALLAGIEQPPADWINGRLRELNENWTISSSAAKPPEVSLRFVYRKSPALIIVNLSDSIAREIKYSVVLWNMDLPERNDPLPIPVATFDWLKPHTEGGPQDLFGNPQVAALLNKGNRLFGSASVNCPECSTGRTFVVYITWGESGWVSEITKGRGDLIVPPNFLRETRESYFKNLDTICPEQSRVPIGDPITKPL